MDSRKLVLFLLSEGETGLERLSKFPTITISRDRFNSKCFHLRFTALKQLLDHLIIAQKAIQNRHFCFSATKTSRMSLQSKPSPFQALPLNADRCPMILELPVTFARS